MRRVLILLLMLIVLSNFSSAAHYMVGRVNDALDGEGANGKEVVLWNPLNGRSDNLTDIIGPTGNSGSDNVYMIDCELLDTPCEIGDELKAKVVMTGNGYTSENASVVKSGAGYTQAENITLNSPPTTSLLNPVDKDNLSQEVLFNCSVNDLDNNSESMTLWGNWSGEWKANRTKTIVSGESYKTFSLDLEENNYKYSCFIEDNLSVGNFALENRTFTVDKTPPEVSEISANLTYLCGLGEVSVNCTAVDSRLEIDTVKISAMRDGEVILNHTTEIVSNNVYNARIKLNSTGDWSFRCVANDSAGNVEVNESENITVYSEIADLEVTNEDIVTNKTADVEFEEIEINATIRNKGCALANNFLAGLYKGDKDLGGVSLENKSESLAGRSSKNVTFTWMSEPGTNNLFVHLDIEDVISESDETNNKANKTIMLTGWQDIFGNITFNKILSNVKETNLSAWYEENAYDGNVFITDKESQISWQELQAIGKDVSGQSSNSDFSEIDSELGMSEYKDSTYNLFTEEGTIKNSYNVSLFGYEIEDVPIINSTDNDNFKTGILWDTSDDGGDGEYDGSEDILFTSKINLRKEGKYGVYDYEIKIPSKLREYYTEDVEEVYYYYELK